MPKHPKSPKKKRSNTAPRRNQRKDAGTVTCEDCGRSISKRGMGQHRLGCRGRRSEQHFDLIIDEDVVHEDMLDTQDDEMLWDDDSMEAPEAPEAPPNPSNSSQFEAVQNTEFLAPSEFTPSPNNQPKDKEIRVEYHPSSNQSPKHFAFEDYTPYSSLGRDPSSNRPPPSSNEPWRPFNTRFDYELGAFALETHLDNTRIDKLISLVKQAIQNPASFTLDSSKDLNATWAAARTKTQTFKKKTISIPYPRPTSQTTVEFDVWTRSLWDWCDELVSDPVIVSHFRWDAERIFKFNSNQQKFERCITEPWTAESWWDVQSRLPKGAKPLCILLYADKTQLSSFGTAKAYPVLARCANLPSDIRNGSGVAGGRLVGWLPIVKEDAGETHKKRFVNLKRVVWHEGFKEVLVSILEYAKTGIWKQCGDNILRWLFPLILILSADYEEQCFMALIRGLGSAFPCPVCLVRNEDLADLSKLPLPERRTTKDMQNVYKEAQLLKQDAREKKLKEYGLRDVENSFWALEHTDVYAALSWDRLHAYHGGLFSDHLWEMFKTHVNDTLGKKSAKQIDLQIDEIPRWSGLNHFSTLMKTSDFADGRKYEDISKIIIYGSHNVLTKDATPEGYLLLQLMRSYLEMDMYASLTMHTDTTIEKGLEELANFDRLLKEYQDQYPDSKNWIFIKIHSQRHLFEDIRNKGVTKNFNSKPNESAHRPLKQFYLRHTNFKDVDPQILRLEENSVVSIMIREELDALDEFEAQNLKDAEANDENLSAATLGGHIIAHISVGSPLRPTSLNDIEASHPDDIAFRDFRRKVISALESDLSARRGHYVKVNIPGSHEITPYQTLKVTYESVIDWEFYTDILRVNPHFHNRPRYDYVLIQATETEYIFAQLLHMFTTVYDSETHYMGLILPMDVPVPALNRGCDKDLSFTRVIARPRSSCVVVHLDTIIRGALLVKDYGAQLPDEHIVLEVIDSDMWWRMKTMMLAHRVKFSL